MDPHPVFTLFMGLPSELRIKIWECSLPPARVVPVRFQRSSGKYTSNSAPPSLLHVCSESRSLFLSSYTKLILSPKYDSSVFVNLEIDTIFFDDLDCSPDGDLSLDLARSPHRDRILSCAMDSQLWDILRVFRFDTLSEVMRMPNLKTIALVMLKDHDVGGLERIQENLPGRETIFIRNSNTVESEMMHVQGWVDMLRADLSHWGKKHWNSNNVPNVQMWLW